MSVLFSSCLSCLNLKEIKHERITNGKMELFCSAFPDGIPVEIHSVEDRQDGSPCANGYSYIEKYFEKKQENRI